MCFFAQACVTPYQKQSWYSHRGGYSRSKLTNNSFKVVFNTNKMTNGGTAIKFALLRSAEVAQLNGFSYFKIAATNDSTMYKETYNGVREIIGRPSVINVIYCHKEKSVNSSARIYDAADVINDHITHMY